MENNIKIKGESRKPEKIIEGVDYYFENELMIFTSHFLEKRGFCCGNGCRHCPYENVKKQNYSK